MWQDSTATAEDIIQGNKGQATITTYDNYGTGYPEVYNSSIDVNCR
jgi:hypothetical protein